MTGHSRPPFPSLTHQERLQFPRPKEGILALRKRHDVTVKGKKKKKTRPLWAPPAQKPREAGCGESFWNARIGDVVTPQEWGVGPKGQRPRGRSPEPGKAIFRLLVKRVRLGGTEELRTSLPQGVKQSDSRTLRTPLSPGLLSPLARLR